MADRATSAEPGPGPLVAVAVALEDPDWRTAVPGVERWARRAALAALGAAGGGAGPGDAGAEVSLVLADDRFVRRLNRRYRGRDAATNVLAFGGDGTPPPAGAPRLLGDVVVALGRARGEAAAGGIPLRDHLAHLVVHGVLHLLGYDHGTDAEAAYMERTEALALAGLGVPDPHARGGHAGSGAEHGHDDREGRF